MSIEVFRPLLELLVADFDDVDGGDASLVVDIQTRGILIDTIALHSARGSYYLTTITDSGEDSDVEKVDSLDINDVMKAFEVLFYKSEMSVECVECNEVVMYHIDNLCTSCFSKQATSAYYGATKSANKQ